MVVSILLSDENQVETKHVESSLVPRLDEGSNPSISTCNLGLKSVQTRQTSDYQIVLSFFVSNPFDSGPKSDQEKGALFVLQPSTT